MFTKFKWHLCVKDFARKQTGGLPKQGDSWLLWHRCKKTCKKLEKYIELSVNYVGRYHNTYGVHSCKFKKYIIFHIETATTNIEIQSRPS